MTFNRTFGIPAGALGIASAAAVAVLVAGPSAQAVEAPPLAPLPSALVTATPISADQIPASLLSTIRESASNVPEKVSSVPRNAVRFEREGGDLIVVPEKGGICFGTPVGVTGGEACVGIPADTPVLVTDLHAGKKFRHTVFSTAAISNFVIEAADGTKETSDLSGGVTTLWSTSAPVRYSWTVGNAPERHSELSPWSLEQK